MSKNIYSYILISSLILMVLLAGYYIVNRNEKFYRPTEVAIADDHIYQTDEEGRIYVKNTFKPTPKKNIVVANEEFKEEEREIVVNDAKKGSVEEKITVENIRSKDRTKKANSELGKGGQEYLQEIYNYKNKQYEEQKRKEEEERQKLLKEEKPIEYTGTDDLRKPSGLTTSQLEKGLKHKLKGLGAAFIGAEQMYNVNAVFLASVAALESNWGRSNYARNRNNLFGYGAYTSNPDHAYYFNSKEDAIYFVARKLSEDYLSANGKFFNGYNLIGVNTKYCTNPQWAASVGKIMKEFY